MNSRLWEPRTCVCIYVVHRKVINLNLPVDRYQNESLAYSYTYISMSTRVWYSSIFLYIYLEW